MCSEIYKGGNKVTFKASDTTKNKVLVTIMGQDYVIKGEEQPEYIEELARSVNERMQNLSRMNFNLTPQKIAVFVAVNLADELKKATLAYENLIKIIEDEKNIL